MQKLVIVESPNKVATIKKYLGDNYEVIASVGHIMTLSTSGIMGLGIDLEKWEPNYVVDKAKNEIVKKLKKAVKEADEVLIATDPDREGEAIGDHLVNLLKIKDKYHRIRYNEITKDAILKAINNPKLIDESLVNAQKARRMLDRIIGFRLSKLMKQKLSNSPTNPSAGRVQSIALKLVVDREKEILAFIPIKYHKANIKLQENVNAHLYQEVHPSGEKDWIYLIELETIKEKLYKNPYTLKVSEIKQTEKKMPAITPLKQSALYKKSPYSSVITQSAAQKLYEGYGDGGLISYPRTDSTRLSETFLSEAKEYVKNEYGENYVSQEIKGVAGDQDAHEAIRPTDIKLKPEAAKEKFNLNDWEYNIYKLIYEHTLQAIIKQPIKLNKAYTFTKNDLVFKSTVSKVLFPGYYVVKQLNDDDESNLSNDPDFKLNQEIQINENDIEITDHETRPPGRYSEGSLIEMLDNIKVGRPSTFASTVKIILDREYVQNMNGALHPTEFGKTVIEKLINGFPAIINEGYTAEVEEQLDLIAEDKIAVEPVMNSFYEKFSESYENASLTMEHTTIAPIVLEDKCPEDQGDLIIKNGRYGKFVGCSNFPNCTYTKNVENKKTFYRKKYFSKKA
ncbi:DNA topoisomerase I [Mycoplasmopsis columbina SF7]|uniref:DNA topoisomerase 1 n=1 Tax=Mycoplasmopsis columbina SF7 TaxID=1037410 RepID=F9UKF5_9BACT|nr:type I DNA topoisomerase [Mycoplasmopsis columbina]EGV00160.1 DNA topoisomerase I [Mycoplasmopsis columbina SF7]